MIERQITLPAGVDDVWKALVDADILEQWFGGTVDWTLTPGSDLTVTETDGSVSKGVVRTVIEGDELQFEWWPEGDEGAASEVTYTLEEVQPDETILTVIERQTSSMDAQMSASTSWTPTDDLLFALWVRTSVPAVIA